MAQPGSARSSPTAGNERAFESPINYLLALDLSWASAGTPTVAGLARSDAEEIYQVATKAQALPSSYTPRDIVTAASSGVPAYSGIQIRRIIGPDAREMVRAASAAGIRLQVISGYRSYAVQVMVFAKWTRKDGSVEQASLYSARPGHSQHQLGTALDFNSFGETFAETPTGRWLWENGHLYGFVFPYTDSSSPRTGYAYEPWHVRWVGRELAGIMESAGYRESSVLIADEFVAAVREVARMPGSTVVFRREVNPPPGYPSARLSGPRIR